MSSKCTNVVFSNRAYNAIIRETFEKDPVETGGILLGHIVDDIWVVMEVLPPGINCIFQTAYFEYDEAFVNYLVHSVSKQYKKHLSLLGLWHRHPGSMDFFSGTDDITNRTFARQLSQGVISGIVNVDPRFRLTMYYLDGQNDINTERPNYEVIDVEVGDDIIPSSFFELKYVSDLSPSNLHPSVVIGNQERKTGRALSLNSAESQQSKGSNISQDAPKYVTRKELGAASDKELFRECKKRIFRIIKNYWKEIAIFVLIMCCIWFGGNLFVQKHPEGINTFKEFFYKENPMSPDQPSTPHISIEEQLSASSDQEQEMEQPDMQGTNSEEVTDSINSAEHNQAEP